MKGPRFVLKFSIILLLMFVFAEASYAQDVNVKKRIKLPTGNLTVGVVLKELLPENEIKVSYNDDLIPFNKVLKFEDEYVRLSTLLDRICSNQNLKWESSGNRILLSYFERPLDDFFYTINGRIRESGTNEPLIGAYIWAVNNKKGSSANAYGFYSLTLPRGEHNLKISYLGHEDLGIDIDLDKNATYNFDLKPLVTQLSDVTIESPPEIDLSYRNTLLGTNRLNMELVGDIPYFLGEVDVFQSSLLLPGITNVGEGTSGINVRGGSSDQNLIMLDEAIIYNSHHFFGLTSVFNPDAVSDIEIYKGSVPVNYGGRLSSIMHVRQRDGNNEEFHASGGIGLITSRLLVEGPLKKNKSSFLVSGRSTFWDFLTRGAENPTIRDSRANFQDINLKLNFEINDRNKLFLSSYFGQDENKFGLDLLRRWGNRLVSARWNRIHNVKLFSNFTAYLSAYRYRVIEDDDNASFIGTSRIVDYAIKNDMTYFRNPEHIYSFGSSFIYHRLTPGTRIPGSSSTNNPIDLGNENALESSLYFNAEIQLNDQITFSPGVRFNHFANIGPGEVFRYRPGETRSIDAITDTLTFDSWENIKTFFHVQPQATLKYQLNSFSALKMNYSSSVQYMHRLSNTITPSSADIWKASGPYLDPSTSDQVSLGYYRYLEDANTETSVEVFYRKNRNIIEFKGGADLLFNPAIETELLSGISRAYGVELFIKKDIGNLTGWLGYTISKSEVQVNSVFEEERINEGQYFPTDFNRTHDLSLSAIYKVSKRWTLSSNFVYQTGRPFTFPIGKYSFDGFVVPHFEERNRQRLPDYHRLDLAARLEGKTMRKNGKPKRNKSFWVFSIYNVYSRRNAQAYIFQQQEENPEQTEVLRFSLLGVLVPSVTYNFKF